MINGKLTYIPMEALVQFLSGVPAGNIDKLELITTPPSKYDAVGNGGYINIVLINNPYAGFNGSYFLTAGYNNRALGAAGVNFNYKSGLVNLYGNYSFNHDHFIQPFTSFTQFTKNGNLISNATFSNRDATQDVQNLRLGIDYQLDSSTIIGVLLGGYNSRWTMIAHNGASINQNHVLDTAITATDDPEINHWQNVMANINFQYSFKGRKVLFLDANYIYYNDNNPNTYSTDYYNNSKKFLFHEDLEGDKITPIHFWVFAADYTAPVGGKITMETGAKLSYSTFTNEVGVNQLKQGKWVQDTSLSSKYQLNENLGAVYTSFTIQVNNKISVTAGLRYEYMESDLGTVKTAHLVNRHYGELFPTFYFSKKINPENSFNFSYSRRITRPAFNDLAPFTIFFDPKTYYSGNPALQPAIANSIQAGYGYKKFIFTISYTNESNTIDNFYFQMQRIDTLSGIVYLSARNFNYEKYLTTSFSLPFNLNRWWSMQNNLSGNWHQVKTSYDRAQLLLHYFDYSFTSIQRFELPKDFSIELTGYYSSASYLGTAKREPFYRLDAGIQKKFGNNADILRFAANDIFNSGGYYRFGEIVPGTGAIAIRTFNFGLAAYKITYTHNFGKRVLKGKRERSTGAEDELNRVHY
jgi:outer membrane receptor protein involved in Fe transport